MLRQSRRSSRVARLALVVGVASSMSAPARIEAQVPSFVQRLGADAWVTRLANPDPLVRRGAAYDLGHFVPGSNRIALELGTVLSRESDLSVLLSVIESLGFSHQTSTLMPFVQVPRTDFPPEAMAAAVRAMERGHETLLGGILARVNPYSSATLNDAVAHALATFPDALFGRQAAAARASPGRLLMVLRAIAVRGDPRWAPYVIDQMRASSATVVLAAIETAVALRLPEAPAELVELARDANDRSVRRAALRGLGALGDAVDPAVMRGALTDPLTRDAALDACGQLGDARFVEAIATLLSGEWTADRTAAADALASIGGRAAADAIDHALAREHDESVRRALWAARSRMAGTTWIPAALGERTGRWAVVSATFRGVDTSASVTRLLPTVSRDAATAMLAGISGRAEAERLESLASTDALHRLDVALSFVSTRTPHADEMLARQLAREDDESVRVALVLALAVGRSAIGDEAIVSLLDREGSAQMPAALAAAAMVGVRRLREAVPTLRSLLATSDDATVRAIAAHSLGRIADPSAAAVLEEAARFDPDAEARGAALIAFALVRGVAALDTVALVDRIAWNERLIDRVHRAERIARGESPDVPFHGTSVVQISGATPGSMWIAPMPDGSTRFAVASSDGEIVLAGMPSTPTSLRRIGASR